MTIRVIVGAVAVVCISVCGVIGTLTSFEMVDKVNEGLSEGQQFGVLGWHPAKTQKLHREYKRLYPHGHLLLKVRVLMGLMVACLLVCAWGFGFFVS
jgi:hypothetical protein